MNIVKELRKKAGVQQKELAYSIGVSRPTVCEWEKNRKDPSGERLKKLAEYFNVDELMILGQKTIDVTVDPVQPKTKEARILARGIDKLPQEQREQALNVMKAMFSKYAPFFEEMEDS